MKKIMSVLLPVMLLLCLAMLFSACGGEAEPVAQTTTARDEITGESASPTESTGNPEITTSPEDIAGQEQTSQEQASDEQPGEQKTQAELLDMYNKALATSGSLKRTQFRRSIATGGLWRTSEPEAVLDLPKEEGMPELIALNETQQAASDLTALDESRVKSIAHSRQNGKDIITIQLRDYSKADLNNKSEAGYVGITTLDESKVLVKDIARSMYSIGAVSISSSTTTMSGGTITATLSDSGQIESVNYTAKQKFDADLKILLVIDAGLTITYDLSAQYQ